MNKQGAVILNPHQPKLSVSHLVHCYLVIKDELYSTPRSWLREYAIPLNWKADSEGWFTEYRDPREVFTEIKTPVATSAVNECICTQNRFTSLQAARSHWWHGQDTYTNTVTGWRVQALNPAEVMQWWCGELRLKTTNV